MADFPDSAKRQLGFFHGLSKVPTESTQNVYESKYKSAHSVKSDDIWADTINYAADIAAADSEAASNSAVTKYTLQSLTMIPGSNGQAWYLEIGSEFIRPFIDPVDIPHQTSNMPSFGYQALLYQNNDTLITPTEGSWLIDYYAGIIKFAEGYDPISMGWGNPKITCYVYTGNTGVGSVNTEEVQRITLTNTDISNKYINLSQEPVNSDKVIIFVEEGLKGENNIDYTIINNQINWNGYDWDGILTTNDVLTVLYWF